ncbi:hypothetical protein Acor_84690 [Acrocarpospora corrugata]|uniref:Uncharacterized protein n=1 Tax=Acrocarpospora corrugata TaxID=35763 RepID=A0A5M3WDR3_9ACTN|nr:hypothetical protein Acor_84690 [Acrocarpospora corrugata]
MRRSQWVFELRSRLGESKEIAEDEPGRRLTKVIDALRDRELLTRAQDTFAETTLRRVVSS